MWAIGAWPAPLPFEAPYRHRRYKIHRERVRCALPAVDVRTPNRPIHVMSARPSRVSEQHQIRLRMRDDLHMMRALSDIMTSKRLDNYNSAFIRSRKLLLHKSKTYPGVSIERSKPVADDSLPANTSSASTQRLGEKKQRRNTMDISNKKTETRISPLDDWPDSWLIRHRAKKTSQRRSTNS